ncbi:chaperone protein EcpD [Pseudomonas gessardii]|uniref:Fimbria/pilus periplasmic chaperone n=1 Tax=Pseudomonas gessardii TaxID=78544 RepID=A0A7Y1QJX6_9PSED|nr:fimbria/pilus periplasmic chaperone [Pseudomonas gessardii]MRU48774.1 molecular chaperone [Pseudomonas gessardii]NNA95131.1 fimbria/pilus periplasmic chaperone [Pseudomonas gessardii]SDQ57901.1 chaperone protein EcpD [Pseudomonas gessardii]
MSSAWMRLALAILGIGLVWGARGEIVIDRTRIIYPASSEQVTVNLTNEADSPRLVQVWIDAGDPRARPEDSDVPFTVTPPILRMDAGQGQALRVAYHGAAAQSDVEQVYWLNVLGIRPAANTSHALQLAFRSRIKLFLRPPLSPGRAEAAAQGLQWRVLKDVTLQVQNPSAYHVSLASVVLGIEGRQYRNDDPPMLAPRSSAIVTLHGAPGSGPGEARVHFTTLDDHGHARNHEAPLSPQ